MNYAINKNPAKFARFAREIFNIKETDNLKAGGQGIDLLKRWFSSIGSPTSLKEAGISGTDIDKIAENASALAKLWGLKNYTKEVIAEILNLCRA
jgi:hypothetical protein